MGALIALQTLYVEPTSAFSIQYSVDMLFMVLVGGMGSIQVPIVGALVLFALQETLSAYGAWYLVIVGGLAVVTTLVASRGLWGLGQRAARLVAAARRLPGYPYPGPARPGQRPWCAGSLPLHRPQGRSP